MYTLYPLGQESGINTENRMQNYILVVSDLVKTLLDEHPLPWASITVGEHRHLIATSTKRVILKTRDAAVAGEVLALANSLGGNLGRDFSLVKS